VEKEKRHGHHNGEEESVSRISTRIQEERRRKTEESKRQAERHDNGTSSNKQQATNHVRIISPTLIVSVPVGKETNQC
jgi:aspartate carbamoyltransferase catalytic subunit